MNSNYNDNNVNVSFDSVSKAAFGIEDPNAERVPIDVAAFDRQREIRKERRLDAVKRRSMIVLLKLNNKLIKWLMRITLNMFKKLMVLWVKRDIKIL